MGRQRTQQPAAVGNAQRALGGGSAPLPAEPRAELEDVAVETSPCRRFRRWDALHSSRVCSDHRRANFPAQVGGLGLPQNCETCHSSRPAPSGARPSHGWLCGHVEFRPTPLASLQPIHDGRRARCAGLRAPGSTPPSPLTAKPGAERLLGSTTILYLSTLGTGADEDRPGGGEGSAYVISVGFCTNYSRNEPQARRRASTRQGNLWTGSLPTTAQPNHPTPSRLPTQRRS